MLAGVLPFIAMCGAFVIGVASETLPACNPFLDGCVSISATGRRPPGSFLFEAVMLPQAVVLAFLWYYAALWLRALDGDLRRSTAVLIQVAGGVGALALIVYVTFLGTKLPVYEFMRRTGIYFGFLGTGLAQIFISVALLRIARIRPQFRLRGKALAMVVLSFGLLALGILNIVMRAILDDSDAAENRIEWIAALCMQAHFVVLHFAWRATGFESGVRVREPGVG